MKKVIENTTVMIERRSGMMIGMFGHIPDDVAEALLQEEFICPDCCAWNASVSDDVRDADTGIHLRTRRISAERSGSNE